MTIDRRVHRRLGLGGAWADVFEVDDKALKLFRSGPEVRPYQMKEGRERIFHCQVDAYRRIEGRDAWLAAHTAVFHGTCTIEDVIDENGESVKDNYLLDCCYMMEVLDLGGQDERTGLYANEVKLKAMARSPAGANSSSAADRYPTHLKHLAEIEERFKQLGIYTYDASVFFPTDPERFKIIDFDLGEYYTERTFAQ